jgi:cytidylate kinase
VNYKVLTVSREFGSGGGRIAGLVAEKLGWKLLDGELIDAIASASHVDPKVVSSYDEHVESWLRRMNRQAMRGAALAAGVVPSDTNAFDPDVAAELSRQIIEQAYKDGGCVIVGRGSQCILQNKCDAYHVFIYAPFKERVKRLRTRLEPGAKIEQRIHTVDGERALYLRQRFGREWNDLHLYDLMISSCENEDQTARVILSAMSGAC